jgi:hypothetical protein
MTHGRRGTVRMLRDLQAELLWVASIGCGQCKRSDCPRCYRLALRLVQGYLTEILDPDE